MSGRDGVDEVSVSDDVADTDGWVSAALSIPLVALLIPLAGVVGSLGFGGLLIGVVGALVGLLVSASVAKSVMTLRHRQRLEVLELQIELAREETARLAEVNRVVYPSLERS